MSHQCRKCHITLTINKVYKFQLNLIKKDNQERKFHSSCVIVSNIKGKVSLSKSEKKKRKSPKGGEEHKKKKKKKKQRWPDI